MTATVTLRMDGSLDHLRLAWQAAESLLVDLPLEQNMDEVEARDTRHNVLVAIQELLTNVLRHGYGAEAPAKPIEFEFYRDAEEFRFEMRDQAVEFDPTAAGLDPRRCEDDGEMPTLEGGFGLVIARQMLDSFSYARQNGWNVLRGSKQAGSPIAAGGGDDGSDWPSA